MKLEQRLMIDGKAVYLIFTGIFCSVYRADKADDSEAVLYFVKDSEVILIQEISADYGQASGYISDINFSIP